MPGEDTNEGEKHVCEVMMKAMRERHEEEISAAMQAWNSNAAARRLYHEAPNDVFDLIVLQLSDVADNGWGKGGLNALRLVSKRCLRVVESVATRLTHKGFADSLPVAVLKRYKRIEHMRCRSVKSLEGCPDGLKSLYIEYGQYIESLAPLSACKELETLEIQFAHQISDLSPLSSCKRLKKLILLDSIVIDLTPLLSMPLLEEVDFSSGTVKDLSTLSHSKKLKKLSIGSNWDLQDLSPLCQCPNLEELDISDLPLIKDLSFFERGFT